MKESDKITQEFKSKVLNEGAIVSIGSVFTQASNSFYTIDKNGTINSISDSSIDEALDALNGKVALVSNKDLKALYEAKMATVGDYTPEEDPEEEHMVAGQLNSICENVEYLKIQVMEEHNWPAWAFEHLTVACDNIEEVTQFFKAETDKEEMPDDNLEMIAVGEAKKKPSAGLSKKEKSAVVKKAEKGEDLGKKGKGFAKVEKAAEKEYGDKDTAKKVAGAAFWKNIKKK